MPDHDGIDGREQVRIDMANVIADGAVMQRHRVHPELRQPHDLADEGVVVGDIFDPVIVAIQAEPDHAQHQNVPEVHPGPTRMRELVADHFFLQQIENRMIDPRSAEDPLETCQHGGQFVPAFKGNHDLGDGRLPEVGLGFESLAQGGSSDSNVALLRAQICAIQQKSKHCCGFP